MSASADPEYTQTLITVAHGGEEMLQIDTHHLTKEEAQFIARVIYTLHYGTDAWRQAAPQ